MKIKKAIKRDEDIFRKKNGMRVTSKGLFLLQEIAYKKAHNSKTKRNKRGKKK